MYMEVYAMHLSNCSAPGMGISGVAARPPACRWLSLSLPCTEYVKIRVAVLW